MDKQRLIDISKNAKDKPNKDLLEVRDELFKEFENTKKLIVDLTRHLDSIEKMYDIVNKEIGNRLLK